MKNTKTLILIAIAAFLFAGSVSAQSSIKVNADDIKGLAGEWVGELEYLDYQNDTKKVVLKLRSTVIVTDGKWATDTVFVEPNGKEVKSASESSLSADGSKISESKSEWTIVKNDYDKVTQKRTIVYESKGQDNNKPSDFRKTVIIGSDVLIRKEVRYDATDTFFTRNELRYTRKP